MRNPIHTLQTHFQTSNWPDGKVAAIADLQFPWGWGEDETATFSENYCIDTCRASYISCSRQQRCGITGGQQRRHPFLPDFGWKPEGSVYQDVQRLCGGQRPFSLCNDLLFARRRHLHHLRRAAERTVAKGGGRFGAAELSVRLEKVESQACERRLSDRAFQIVSRLADWHRLRKIREVPCSPKS